MHLDLKYWDPCIHCLTLLCLLTLSRHFIVMPASYSLNVHVDIRLHAKNIVQVYTYQYNNDVIVASRVSCRTTTKIYIFWISFNYCSNGIGCTNCSPYKYC